MTSLLSELAQRHNSDKLQHTFTDFYHGLLAVDRLAVTKVLEIGIFHGGSLLMWADYFPNAIIHGVDIEPKTVDHPRIKCHQVDQGSKEALVSLITTIGGDFDFIIDDGSHIIKHQQISWAVLYPHLKSGGYYIIEDLHTSLIPWYQTANMPLTCYGLTTDNTFDVLYNYQRSGHLRSQHLTTDEALYIQARVVSITTYWGNTGMSVTSALKKR